MEIFLPVFLALVLHSGIIRLLDEIQMYFVSKRVTAKVRDILSEEKQQKNEELEDILALLKTKEKRNKENNDPNGEWRYLD